MNILIFLNSTRGSTVQKQHLRIENVIKNYWSLKNVRFLKFIKDLTKGIQTDTNADWKGMTLFSIKCVGDEISFILGVTMAVTRNR